MQSKHTMIQILRSPNGLLPKNQPNHLAEDKNSFFCAQNKIDCFSYLQISLMSQSQSSPAAILTHFLHLKALEKHSGMETMRVFKLFAAIKLHFLRGKERVIVFKKRRWPDRVCRFGRPSTSFCSIFALSVKKSKGIKAMPCTISVQGVQ